MIALVMAPGRHLDGGTLVRYIDGETGIDERAAIESHLAACADCRTALERVDRRSSRISRMMELTDPPGRADAVDVPASRRRGIAGWRTAAVLALAVGLALSSSTVRAWVSGGWRAATSVVGSAPTDRDDSAEALPAAETVRAAFEPRPGPFVIRFRSWAAGGTLVVEPADSDETRVHVIAASSDPIRILPAGLTIENSARADSDYRVVVPPTVDQVTIEIGGISIGPRAFAGLADGWRVSLLPAQ